jgi:hypothetical protein
MILLSNRSLSLPSKFLSNHNHCTLTRYKQSTVDEVSINNEKRKPRIKKLGRSPRILSPGEQGSKREGTIPLLHVFVMRGLSKLTLLLRAYITREHRKREWTCACMSIAISTAESITASHKMVRLLYMASRVRPVLVILWLQPIWS